MPAQPATPGAPHAAPGPSRSSPAPRVARRGVATLPDSVVTGVSGQVLRHWPAESGPPPARGEVADLLSALAANILETQVTTAPVIDPRAHSLLGKRLLELLRTGVMRAWDEGGLADGELGRLLVAIERVREAVADDSAHALAAHLAGADGAELLVEVAHDLRSPLTSILFLAETLQRGQSGPVTDVQRRQLGLIYTAALGLSNVASDIVDLTRSDQLIEPSPVPFSVAGMLDAIRDIVRPIAEEKQLALRLLPPAVDERLGHPTALGRVLLNLTTNALKFTHSGYVEIVAHDVGLDRVEFSVRDSGRGIDPAIVSTLYDPLRKTVGRAGWLFSQTGLGLTICRKLTHALGSELRVETRPEWGTRFFLELDMPACTSPRSSGPSGLPPLRSERRHLRRG